MRPCAFAANSFVLIPMKSILPLVIGRYEILAELGRGTMGVVYKARDPKIDRIVAIKTILLFDLNGPDQQEYQERFQEEARAAGRLSHPGIVTIFDVESDPENAHPHIVMEYVDGKPLSKLLDDNGGRLPLEPALRLAQEIAEALHLAHSQGIVHRDVKPENILVTPEGHPKIADFGIARLDHGHLTVPGRMLGSPAYMSPEQLEGAHTDARSDLFSLGVVLYTMLTGHRPFQGNSTATVCFKVANRNPLPVSSWNLDFPPELDELVGRAMAKDPAERFQNGREMAGELQAFRETHVTPPQPLAGIMRIIGQEPEATQENAPEAVVAQIPAMVIAQKGSDPGMLPAVVSSALHSKSPLPPKIASAARSISAAGPLFLSSGVRAWISGATLATLIILGLALRTTSRHSATGVAVPPVTQKQPANPVKTLPATAASAVKSIQEPQENPRRSETRATQTATKSAKTSTIPVQRRVAIPAAPSIRADVASTRKVVPPSPDSITVQMVHLSDLNVTIEHSFEQAQASISVDNHPVYTEQLSGQKKRRALVFSRTEGRQSGTITLLPGKHDIVVRVQSAVDGYDASQTLTRGFSPGSTNELVVKCDKRKNKLELLLK